VILKSRRISVLLTCALSTWSLAQAAEPAFSPKVSLRTGNGVLQNSGSAGGDGLAIGSLGVLANYFVTGNAAVGLGYSVNHPFSSAVISSRYYFAGQGTRSRAVDEFLIKSERRDTFAHYFGLDLNQISYVLSSNRPGASPMDAIPGTSSVLSASIGTDLWISRHFELNAEANAGLFVLAASNNAVRVKGYMLNTGISYVW